MPLARRLSAVTLIVSLLPFGLCLQTHASEKRPYLTLKGQPLSQLLNSRTPLLLASMSQDSSGVIRGIAATDNGDPLVDQLVRLRSFRQIGPRVRSQIVSTTETNLLGHFEFSEVAAGEYYVDMQIGNQVSLSETIVLTQEAMLVRGISLTHEGGMSGFKKIAIASSLAAGITLFLGFSLFSGETYQSFIDGSAPRGPTSP